MATYNGSAWKSELEAVLAVGRPVATVADVVCLQETRVHKSGMPGAVKAALAEGWDLEASACTTGKHGRPSAGVGVASDLGRAMAVAACHFDIDDAGIPCCDDDDLTTP